VPGVAGNRTTAFNHRMVLDPRCRAGVLDGNPAHEDLLEACGMVGPDFLLNVVLSPQGGLLHVAAGHFDEAHRAGCRAAARLLGTAIGAPFGLLVASSGGSPLDIDLRQAHKGMENACAALRKGGSLFYYAECGDGLGSGMLEEYLRRFASAAAMEEALRADFAVGGHKALWLARLGECYDVHFVTRLDPFFVRRCGFRPVAPEEHEARLEELIRSQRPERVGVMPNASFTVPVCGR
jgi:nickel-dependent lactate racemase